MKLNEFWFKIKIKIEFLKVLNYYSNKTIYISENIQTLSPKSQSFFWIIIVLLIIIMWNFLFLSYLQSLNIFNLNYETKTHWKSEKWRFIINWIKRKIINYKNKTEKLNLIFFLRYFIIKMWYKNWSNVKLISWSIKEWLKFF